MTDRFRHRPTTFVGIAHPRCIYIGVERREDFDRIDRPAHDHGENENGHVLTKSVEEDGVMVVFQYWLKSLTSEALAEQMKQRAAERVAQPAPPAAIQGPTMHPVDSSNIASIGHDGKDLFVAFKSGGTYRYDAVPVATFDGLRSAKSVGSYLHADIRGKYEAVKIEEKAAQ